MDEIRAYIFSVTAGAVLCAIVRSITSGKQTAWAVELVTGLVMCLVVIGPLTRMEIPNLDRISEDLVQEGEAAAAYGTQMAAHAQNGIIKEQLQAYILEKAESMSARIAVEVVLDDTGMPAGVICTGVIPTGTRAALVKIINDDLGIPEEAQIWTQAE